MNDNDPSNSNTALNTALNTPINTKTIKVDYLARVEGEGALYVRYNDNAVEDVKLKIFEPPRFFESFLRGRHFMEAPDITARICGICPVAYQMSAVHAMENALGASLPGEIRQLRRLLYCGEWIESHVLHIAMLHAPDFLGYDSAIAMAKDHPQIVEQALKLKKIGNSLVATLAGREIHPINVRVGGFYKAPLKKQLQALCADLEQARQWAMELAKWSATLNFPAFERPQGYEFVALHHADEYPMNEGRIISNQGMDIAVSDYETLFEESHVPYTNALHSMIKTRGAYFVGPLARFNLNFERLTPLTRQIAGEIGFNRPCNNPFESIVVRSLEVVHACDEALQIIASYQRPGESFIELQPKAATGFAATEAPRGLLYHRYSLDDEGLITEAKIVPPTSQNQKTIEEDLQQMIPGFMALPEDKLQHLCEQAIRNYDPCISCATHFLNVHLEKAPVDKPQ